ncbi:MAG: FN3 associated domain-containing protein [Syntrophomonas sp.]
MLVMNQPTRCKRAIAILLILSLSLLAGCYQPEQASSSHNKSQPAGTPGYLTITGNGVEQQTRFSLSELKDMKEAAASECYSVVNDWPTKKFTVGNGIRVSYLLEKAGIKEDAQIITVWAADGYNATFTKEQLTEKRFYYPKLLEGSEESAKEVPAILAWKRQEGTNDLSKATSCSLCLLLGQKGLNDSVAPVCVKDVVTLEVLTTESGRWDKVQAEPVPGKVKQGTEVFLQHPEMDGVKVYYTIDGSTPDEKSLLYNPSTTYYHPELTKPIIINQPVTIKTIAIGFGKHNSQISSFTYGME